MFTLYIADDEPVIIKGLIKMIQSFSLPVKVIGHASDGKTALRELLELKPDILITDVQMPEKTGLELISYITEKNMSTRCIFLSGYQEFKYIKHAISHEAVEYLLKPVSEQELQQALIRAIEFFSEKQKLQYFETNTARTLKGIIGKSSNGKTFIIPNRFIQELTLSDLYEKSCSFSCIQFLIPFYIQEKLKTVTHEHFELLRFTAINFIKERCQSFSHNLLLSQKGKLLEYAFLLDDFSEELLYHFLEETSQMLIERYGIRTLISIGCTVETASEINDSYQSCLQVSEQYFFTENLINKAEASSIICPYTIEDYDSLFNKIVECTVRHDENTLHFLTECLNIIWHLHYGKQRSVINRVLIFAATFHKKMEDYHLLHNDNELYNQFVQDISTATTYRHLKSVFVRYYQNFLDSLTNSSHIDLPQDILLVRQYIDTHYTEQLSLKQLADMIYMNPSYFSHYWKKNTGESYKNYLTRIRIEKSIPLLLSTDYKLYQIAEQVGYKNVKYYTAAFKGIYGCTPAEYKSQNTLINT